MSFDIARTALLLCLDENADCFGNPSLESQDMLLKRCFSDGGSVVDEGQASPAVAAGTDVPNDRDGDWDFGGAVHLDDVERVEAGRRMRGFKDGCRFAKQKVPETVAETFELATGSVDQEAFPDIRSSPEVVPEIAPTTSKVERMKAHGQ